MNNLFDIEKTRFSSPFKAEKEKAVDFIERRLSNTGWDFTLVNYPAEVIEQTIAYYQLFLCKQDTKFFRVGGHLKGKDWLEKISQAQSKEDVELSQRIYSKIDEILN